MSELEPFDPDAERSIVGAIISAGCLDVAAGHRVLDTVYGQALNRRTSRSTPSASSTAH